MAIQKEHKEFYTVDLSTGWHTPPGYPEGIQQQILAGFLDEKNKRGFRHESEWMVCNKCDKSFRLSEVNAGGGGCKPVPLRFQLAGGELLIAQADVLAGWRLFH